jgi:multiple sugar transport system permease protein
MHRTKSRWLTVVGVLLLSIYLFPIYWMVIASIKSQNNVFSNPPEFLPLHPDFSAWQDKIFADPRIVRYIKNSFIVGIGTMLLTLFLAAPAGYALAKLRLRGKNAIMLFCLSSLMLPSIMVATPLFVIFTDWGLRDKLLGLVLADTTLALPYGIVLLRPTFLGIPKDLSDAAQIDGSSPLGAFLRVVLPLARPGIATVAILSFLWGWGDYVFALTLTADEDMRVVTTGLANFFGQNTTDWTAAMAFASVAMLPPLVVFLVGQRQVIAGLMSGGAKG